MRKKSKDPDLERVLLLRETQRVQMHHQLVNSALYLTEWYWQDDMRFSSQYQDRDYQLLRYRRIRNQLLGSTETGFGLLQQNMNLQMDGIFDRMHLHFPHWDMNKQLLFSYYSAGFTNFLVQHLLDLSTANAASVLKCRMLDEIDRLNRDERDEYLALLPRRSCRIGCELRYL